MMKRAETAAAVLITLAVIMLHIVRLYHAGGLWRDEAGAVQLARELGPGKTVVTVAVDTGLKYLAGDLFTG